MPQPDPEAQKYISLIFEDNKSENIPKISNMPLYNLYSKKILKEKKEEVMMHESKAAGKLNDLIASIQEAFASKLIRSRRQHLDMLSHYFDCDKNPFAFRWHIRV